MAIKRIRLLASAGITTLLPSMGRLGRELEPRVLRGEGTPHLVGRPPRGGLAVWNLLSGMQVWFLPLNGLTALAVSTAPHTSYLALGGRDGSVQIRHASTGDGMDVLTFANAPVSCLHWEPDGLLSVGMDNGSFCIWDAAQNRRRLWNLGEAPQSALRVGECQWAVATSNSVRMLDERRKGWTVLDDRPQFRVQLAFAQDCVGPHLIWRRSGSILSWDFRRCRPLFMTPWSPFRFASALATAVRDQKAYAVVGFQGGDVQLRTLPFGCLRTGSEWGGALVTGVMPLGPEAPDHYAIADQSGNLSVWDSDQNKVRTVFRKKGSFETLLPIRIRDLPGAVLIDADGMTQTIGFTY